MAKLEKFEAGYQLINGIACDPAFGDFPLIDAHNVQVTEGGKTLDLVLEELAGGNGGGLGGGLDEETTGKIENIKTDVENIRTRVNDIEYTLDNMDGVTVEEKSTDPTLLTFVAVMNDAYPSGSYSVSCADASLERIIIPRYYDGKPVSEIGSFQSCAKLKHITIPNTVTKISDCAFQNVSELIDMHIPKSVTHIGRNAFLKCTNLVAITIPDSVTSIGAWIASTESAPSTVIYCEATSKPDGWDSFWNGSGSYYAVPVVWGADLADIKPTVRAAEYAQSAGRASAVEGFALGTCYIDNKLSTDGSYFMKLYRQGVDAPVNMDDILSISGDISSTRYNLGIPFHLTFPSSSSTPYFYSTFLTDLPEDSSIMTLGLMRGIASLYKDYANNVYLRFNLHWYLYESGNLTELTHEKDHYPSYTYNRGQFKKLEDPNSDYLTLLRNVVIIRRK